MDYNQKVALFLIFHHSFKLYLVEIIYACLGKQSAGHGRSALF
jgi:hypothetical protein